MDDAFANIASFLGPGAALPPPAPARARAAAPAAPPRAAARAAPLLPALEEAKAPPRVRAVVFSKDRAFQLRCLLRSLARAPPSEVFVLWRADGETSAKAYASVQAEFPSHRFLCDGDAGPAANLAIALADAEFVWFLVDDSLIIDESFKVVEAATALRRDERLLAVHARLHPGVTWCHPQDAPCAPPATFDVDGDVGSAPWLLTFARSGLGGDWAYCWDLAGGLYRGTDASAVVRDIVRPGPGNDAAAHPNRLEANGNAALRRLGITSQRPRSACPAVKTLVVVTVNRVQDVYSAPVYLTPAPSLGALDSLVVNDASADLDAAAYAKTSHDSAHVGDWFPAPQERPKPPRVSVLIAAKNEEATIVDAVRSALDEGDIVEEVVVIDDHSTDGTRAAVTAIDDARVRVLESSGHGLAEALNFGLQRCACDIVARLDADDVFAAGQLGRHAARFAELRRTGRGVAVLGGSAVSWWPDGARAPLLRARTPDPKWALLFSCCIAHPTVLLDRKAVLDDLGGYNPAAEPAEDYDLWLRAADAGAGVANASDIPRTWLRKRSTSVSSARRAAQEAAADAAVARSIERRVGTELTRRLGLEPPPAVLSALRRPATCESADALDDAATLLSSLRAHAVAALADDVRATKRVDADASQRLAELQACGLRLGRVLGVSDGKLDALRGLCAAAAACKVSSVGDASAAES